MQRNWLFKLNSLGLAFKGAVCNVWKWLEIICNDRLYFLVGAGVRNSKRGVAQHFLCLPRAQRCQHFYQENSSINQTKRVSASSNKRNSKEKIPLFFGPLSSCSLSSHEADAHEFSYIHLPHPLQWIGFSTMNVVRHFTVAPLCGFRRGGGKRRTFQAAEGLWNDILTESLCALNFHWTRQFTVLELEGFLQ